MPVLTIPGEGANEIRNALNMLSALDVLELAEQTSIPAKTLSQFAGDKRSISASDLVTLTDAIFKGRLRYVAEPDELQVVTPGENPPLVVQQVPTVYNSHHNRGMPSFAVKECLGVDERSISERMAKIEKLNGSVASRVHTGRYDPDGTEATWVMTMGQM